MPAAHSEIIIPSPPHVGVGKRRRLAAGTAGKISPIEKTGAPLSAPLRLRLAASEKAGVSAAMTSAAVKNPSMGGADVGTTTPMRAATVEAAATRAAAPARAAAMFGPTRYRQDCADYDNQERHRHF